MLELCAVKQKDLDDSDPRNNASSKDMWRLSFHLLKDQTNHKCLSSNRKKKQVLELSIQFSRCLSICLSLSLSRCAFCTDSSTVFQHGETVGEREQQIN